MGPLIANHSGIHHNIHKGSIAPADSTIPKFAVSQPKTSSISVTSFFVVKKLRKALDGLPDRIVPDDKMFRLHYEEEFYKGERSGSTIRMQSSPLTAA